MRGARGNEKDMHDEGRFEEPFLSVCHWNPTPVPRDIKIRKVRKKRTCKSRVGGSQPGHRVEGRRGGGSACADQPISIFEGVGGTGELKRFDRVGMCKGNVMGKRLELHQILHALGDAMKRLWGVRPVELSQSVNAFVSTECGGTSDENIFMTTTVGRMMVLFCFIAI